MRRWGGKEVVGASASLVSTFSSSEHSLRRKRNLRDMDLGGHCSVQTGVGFSPPRSVNLPFCHLGLLKGRFSSL